MSVSANDSLSPFFGGHKDFEYGLRGMRLSAIIMMRILKNS